MNYLVGRVGRLNRLVGYGRNQIRHKEAFRNTGYAYPGGEVVGGGVEERRVEEEMLVRALVCVATCVGLLDETLSVLLPRIRLKGVFRNILTLVVQRMRPQFVIWSLVGGCQG